MIERANGNGAYTADWMRFITTAARISLVAIISASYALLSACELWYARDRDLLSTLRS